MTKGEGAASAAVRFEADGREYLSRWSRRTKRTGRLSEDEVELVAFASPEDRTDASSPVRSACGKRDPAHHAHVLPDLHPLGAVCAGRLLQLPQGCRTTSVQNLLEKITGTDLYSAVSMKIFEKNRSARDSLDMAVARLEGMQILSDEDRRALEQTVTELSLKVPAMEKSLERAGRSTALAQGTRQTDLRPCRPRQGRSRRKGGRGCLRARAPGRPNAPSRPQSLSSAMKSFSRPRFCSRNKSELAEAESQLEAVRTALPDLEATLKTAATAERGAAATRDGFMPEYRRMLEADEGIRRLSHQASTAQKTAEAAFEAEKIACADLETAAARQKKAADESARLQERMTTTSADAQLETPLALLKQSAAAIEALSTRLRQEEQNADTLVGRLELGRVKTASFEAEVKAAVEAHAACQTTLEQARKTLAAMQAKSSLRSHTASHEDSDRRDGTRTPRRDAPSAEGHD